MHTVDLNGKTLSFNTRHYTPPPGQPCEYAVSAVDTSGNEGPLILLCTNKES